MNGMGHPLGTLDNDAESSHVKADTQGILAGVGGGRCGAGLIVKVLLL